MNNNMIYLFSAAEFALWELHLYLDTHPCDEKAKELFKEYTYKSERIKEEYERIYGPLTSDKSCAAEWTKEPWPWQHSCKCGGEK